MRTPREPTTRKEIDAEIQRLSDEISDIRDDYRATTEDIIEGTESFVHNYSRDFHAEILERRTRIKQLTELKESMARPFEKVRPSTEQQLQAYGVTL